MIGAQEMADVGARLADRAGEAPPTVFDVRIDPVSPADDPALLRHVQHQALLRANQGRYVLLPGAEGDDDRGIVERLRRHYDPAELARLEGLRTRLEAELLGPLVAEAEARAAGHDALAYLEALPADLRARKTDPFLDHLEEHPHREAHYRNFLIQSSADLLAEASASALGVIGEFGEAQSALFRILIDEFGYGTHARKHSVRYRATLAGFGLCGEYNAYWPWFDTVALELHNAIHHLFQSPRRLFRQVGFLVFAETAYQGSTARHFRYLKRFHPDVDARYFGEHAHIDLHHTAMVIEEVAVPFVRRFGPEAGAEILAGCELTRLVFDRAGAHLLAVSRAFDAAAARGLAVHGAPDPAGPPGRCVTPSSVPDEGRVQVGGLGTLTEAGAFRAFPAGATGRLVEG